MRLVLLLTASLFLFSQSLNAQDAPGRDTTWTPLAPGAISTPDATETSPSVTADGQTMMFARTTNWTDKVPYLATRDGDGWTVQRLPFADTLYNAAIVPDGSAAIFKRNETENGEDVSRAYRVERTENGWGEPREIESLFNINAGYFQPMNDGTLYFFARSPRPGIYVSTPDDTGTYGAPTWLSDAVSPDGTTSFDVLVHPDEDRLIITRAGIPDGREDELGPRGFFYYEKRGDAWTSVKRLPLPYGWGATALPDGRFLFVDAGDLHTVPFESLGIDWTGGF